MPAQLIEAHERTIGQIFDDAYAFEIPAYQRPYAWEIDQVRELLTDLLEAKNDEGASGGVYFLGSIVLIKSPNDPQSKVIDGQQRLTTLTILLSVLRDLTTDTEKRIDRRRYIFQKANSDRGTSERFRVLLRPRDRAFFLKAVQQPDSTNSLPDVETLAGSHLRIATNAQYLREQLESMDEASRDALIAFVLQRCYLVVVAVPTAEAARRIFTVLNARGLDLTPTDILKADLLDRAGEASETSLADRWENIEQAATREGLVELFGHVRMIYEREKPRLALEASFAKVVTPFQGDASQFISAVLEPIADAFLLLRDDQGIKKQFGSEAAKAIRSLARIDNKDWVPPALLKLWRRRPGESDSVAEFLRQLERVAYYLFVTRQGVNERIARFSAIMNEIDPRPNTPNSAGLSLSEFEQAEFLQELDGDLYQKSRVCKPVLQRLDEALSTGGASYDELISIEHVLPQTVEKNSEWEVLFPDEVQRLEWTHRLANLVFLTHRVNTRASNWDFKRKKAEYFTSEDGSSPFVITQEVLRTEEWSLDHLIDRQNRLLKKLADVWAIDISKIQNEDVLAEQSAAKEPRGFTEPSLIEAKRQLIVQTFSKREGKLLTQNGKATFTSADETGRVICTISKRYRSGAPYWYGYHPRWEEFLSKGKNSFLILGCMDRDEAYVIPHEWISKILKNLHKSTKRHWHIALEEDASGNIQLSIPKTNSMAKLGEFELKLPT